MNVLKLLILFISLVVIHAIYNLINFLRYNHIETLLIGNYTNNVKLNTKAKIHKNEILNYIKNAGVKDKHINAIESLGYNQIASGSVSIFDNILNTRVDIANNVRNLLLEAKGNYWSRFINSANPFYWLKIILYIPKYLLSYLGLDAGSVFVKIFQLIYWAIGIIFTIIITVFTDEIKTLILSFIHFS